MGGNEGAVRSLKTVGKRGEHWGGLGTWGKGETPATTGERSLRPWWKLSCQGRDEGALFLTWLGWVGESRGSADPPCLT